ncbi:NADH dehydrogenase subunit 5 [Staphylococcus massiliensis]|uniref:Probable inorganic carbon transporter subunit DabB n=1 Tax=Staphylococcus massiliensis S46 TaxID=1229783 RepID=K9ARQ2_9STAP|nr:NADH dehydrogenase subunit 5 [Staphylococcus massiliensis]EKU45292.1 NADH dehydrogenase subunit 5 [Staphylococcus massiliensis S46]MCG3413601.1 NADH dehydrogenase subunit 5 [Staphylococcus massiliensis]
MFFIAIFFISLILLIVSGLAFIFHKVDLTYIKVHIVLTFMPIIASILLLVFVRQETSVGPLSFNSLSIMLSVFIFSIGFIIQKFSIRYLLGNKNYRKYFFLFTTITTFASIAWLSDDLRSMLLFWGGTLLCLVSLIWLNKTWKVARSVARTTFYIFLASWISFLVATILLFIYTKSWAISSIKSVDLPFSVKIIISLLMIFVVIIPAAQFPFQRWLIETAATPTPVSAIMHAGIVNAGGIILGKLSFIVANEISMTILLIISSLTVLIGSGISLVHVDYKRQLIGSTMSQMGFMLIQCALGAYLAAIIHLILHGVFKATLFLQSGSALEHTKNPSNASVKYPYVLVTVGKVFSVLIAFIYWNVNQYSFYTLVSATVVYFSLSVAWKQLVAYGSGVIGRILGFATMIFVCSIYILTHNFFATVLYSNNFYEYHPSLLSLIITLVILLSGNILNIWTMYKPNHPISYKLYIKVLELGEASESTIESHPSYLVDKRRDSL